MELMKRLINGEEGQGLVEYGLIIALIAVIAIVALQTVGGGVVNVLNNISAQL